MSYRVSNHISIVMIITIAHCDLFLGQSHGKVCKSLEHVKKPLSFVTQITLLLWFTKRIVSALKLEK
jgi:hypothetical protein